MGGPDEGEEVSACQKGPARAAHQKAGNGDAGRGRAMGILPVMRGVVKLLRLDSRGGTPVFPDSRGRAVFRRSRRLSGMLEVALGQGASRYFDSVSRGDEQARWGMRLRHWPASPVV